MRRMNLLGGNDSDGVRALVRGPGGGGHRCGLLERDEGHERRFRRADQPAAETTIAAGPLKILVTNDDGVGAAGIDAVVEALRKLPDTQVTVVAPATNQSNTGGQDDRGPAHRHRRHDRQRLPGQGGGGLPGRHRPLGHRRPRHRLHPRRGGLGHQLRPEPRADHRSVRHGGGRPGGRGPPHPRPGLQPGTRRSAPTSPPGWWPWWPGCQANREALASGQAKAAGLIDNLNIPTCTTGARAPAGHRPRGPRRRRSGLQQGRLHVDGHEPTRRHRCLHRGLRDPVEL